MPGRPFAAETKHNNYFSHSRAPFELNTETNQTITTQNITQWIANNNVDNTISEMATVIMTFKPGIDDDAEIFKSTTAQITSNVARGYSVLNQLIAVGEFSDNNLNHEKIINFTTQMNKNGFIKTLQEAINTLKFKGRSLDELQKLTAQYKNGRNLIDILQYGQRALMKPNFKPNGYNQYRQSPSYEQYRAVCNYHMFELLYQGKAIIIPMATVVSLHQF